MARRGAAEIELEALEPGERRLSAGTHLIYAARGDCVSVSKARTCDFARNTLKVELTGATRLALVSGLAVLGSLRMVG